MTGKERYDDIEIPSRLSGVIQDAMKRGRAHKRNMAWLRGSSALVAACAAFIITANVPGVAMALSDVLRSSGRSSKCCRWEAGASAPTGCP